MLSQNSWIVSDRMISSSLPIYFKIKYLFTRLHTVRKQVTCFVRIVYYKQIDLYS